MGVEGEDGQARRVVEQQQFGGAQAHIGGQHAEAHGLAAGQFPFVQIGGHAFLGPGSPVEAGGGQAVADAEVDQSIHVGVGGGVVGLARHTDQGRQRGEQPEEVQLEVAGGAVQVPGAVDLGSHDLLEGFRALVQEEGVFQHTGRVDQAAQGCLRALFLDQSLEGGAVGDVHGGGLDHGTVGADGLQALGRWPRPACAG